MSATDELRRLLDERGVEWTAPNSCLRDEMTSWAAGGFYYDAFEVPEPDGTFLLTAAHQDDLTPEQAVEATLGSDLKAENEKLRELVRDMYKSMDMSCQFSHAIPPSTMAHIKNRAIGLGVNA